MQRISFETSLGKMRGIVRDTPPRISRPFCGLCETQVRCKLVDLELKDGDRLSEIISFHEILLRPDGWVTVVLEDDWYGNPEYKAIIET